MLKIKKSIKYYKLKSTDIIKTKEKENISRKTVFCKKVLRCHVRPCKNVTN